MSIRRMSAATGLVLSGNSTMTALSVVSNVAS
jgi:hypothetical protein